MRHLITSLILIFGVVEIVRGEVAAAVSAAAAAAGAITSGASMIHGMANTPNYRVVCKIEIENWTKYPLFDPESYINGGMLQSPPPIVQPGKREMFIAHKTGYTASGSYGTASWLISGKNRRAVIMWSCPFNFDYHMNWLAVGLTTPGYISHQNWYDQMYNGMGDNKLKFSRGDFYYHTKTISQRDDDFIITGSSGTSHTATVKITVRPRSQADYAPAIKALLRKKK